MSLQLIETSRGTQHRLASIQAPAWTKGASGSPGLHLNPAKKFQTILGFGGAFTESTAYTLTRIPAKVRTEILENYFHPEKGIGYTLCRTHINSCDFSLGNWACDEVPGDVELTHFNLDRTRHYIIPAIKEALKIKGGPILMLASPWSPPFWMKTNGEMNNGGQLRPEYRDAWALWYARFAQEMEKEGIPIWGVTVQNEPAAVQRWDSCIYSAEEERDFVRDHLGPALEKNGCSGVKILVWDHNKDIFYDRVAPILKDPAAARHVWGIGFHWYGGEQPEQMDKVTGEFPDKPILATEACWEGGVKLGQWDRGQRYAHHMLIDFNHGAVGWIDWNLVLDEMGGPNHVGNFCDAPVIADTRSGQAHYQSSFYYIGHFSKYIKPGARRIQLDSTDCALESAAFQNTDGTIAVIVHNSGETAQPFRLGLGDSGADCQCPALSIQTYLLRSS